MTAWRSATVVCGGSYKHVGILRASNGRWEPAGGKAGKVATQARP